jgi:DNA-binding MarR family transcriptional regulator
MSTLADAAKRHEGVSRDGAGRGEFRLSESPSHLLRRAEQFAAEIFQRVGLSDGVTLRQTVLLAAIAEAEGASQSGLVRATGVDRSTLAEMMARMEKKGLIARQGAAGDKRAKSVKLTADGRARLEAALPAIRKVDTALLRALPANKRSSFRSTLAALADASDRIHEEEVEEQKKAKHAAKAKRSIDNDKARRKRKKKDRKRLGRR